MYVYVMIICHRNDDAKLYFFLATKNKYTKAIKPYIYNICTFIQTQKKANKYFNFVKGKLEIP